MLRPMPAADSSALTLLVVDDQPQLRRLLTRLFERRGCRVWSAGDGHEAARLFEEHRDEIDVAVLDVLIPPDGAGALLSRLSGLRDDVGWILTSGAELLPDLRDRLAALGGVFLRKPFSPEEAHAAVRRVTPVRSGS